MATMKEISRKEYTGQDSREDIQLGALQRIADATEKMAQRHTELINDRDRYMRWYDEERQRRAAVERSNQSLRGQITKLRKRLAPPANNSEGA